MSAIMSFKISCAQNKLESLKQCLYKFSPLVPNLREHFYDGSLTLVSSAVISPYNTLLQ